MKHVSVLDQGSAGYCYAYAASELMDAWRFSHGDVRFSQTVSPIPLAMDYGLNISKSDPPSEIRDRSYRFGERGDTCSVINAIGAKPRRSVCTQAGVLDRYPGKDVYLERTIRQSILPGDNQSDLEDSPATAQFLGYLDVLYQNEVNRYDSSQLSSLGVAEIKRQLQILGFGAQAPNSTKLKKLLNQPDPVLFVDGVITAGCSNPKNQIELPELSCKSMNRGCLNEEQSGCGDPAPLVEEIDRRLEMANAQPVAIGIDSEILLEKGNSGPNPDHKMNANHEVLIVGRRKAGNSCQYLIRNSHGENCPDFGGCNSGDIWLDEALLKRSLFEISWLE